MWDDGFHMRGINGVHTFLHCYPPKILETGGYIHEQIDTLIRHAVRICVKFPWLFVIEGQSIQVYFTPFLLGEVYNEVEGCVMVFG